MSHRIADLAAALGLDFAGDGDLRIDRPAHPADAGPDDLAVAMDPKIAKHLRPGPRAAILWADAPWRDMGFEAALFAPRPRYAMAGLTTTFQHPLHAPQGIHPTALVDPTAEIGEGAAIGPFCIVGAGVRLGPRARLLSHVTIGAQAQLGSDVLLHPGVRIGDRCVIGDRFIAQANAVVGADGFSYVTLEPGAVEAAKARGASDVTGGAATVHNRIHSLGAVRLGHDVELGACATLDRGTIRDTMIGAGTKIDNLVMVGHNTVIGEHCLICAQVGIAGSCEIGDRVILGGQAGVADHIRIGSDSVIAGDSGIGATVPPRSVMMGTPAMKRDEFYRVHKAIRRLPRLMDRLAGRGPSAAD